MTAARMNLLLVEDDPQIQRFLATALDAHGYALAIAGSGAEGLKLAALRQPDILIVDLGLPDMSGLDVIRRVREWCMRPLLVLSARDRESDKVAALDLGADDYLTKPFRLTELMARLRAHLRRSSAGRSDERFVTAGRLTLDLAARRASYAGTDIALRPKEFDLLARLVSSAGEVVTREDLIDQVWDTNWFGPTKTLDVHISALRRKLAQQGADPGSITTLRGRGYRYERD